MSGSAGLMVELCFDGVMLYHLPFCRREKGLLVLVLVCVIDHIEEPQLVDTLGCGDHAEPISQLLLLEKLLCPMLLV